MYRCGIETVYVERNGIDLYPGRRVRLESTEYFPETGYRLSRITKITRKVALPSQVDLEIGDALSTGVQVFVQFVMDAMDGVPGLSGTA